MQRRTFLAACGAAPLRAQPARKPNVVLILTDDQGYGDLSLHGNDKLKTPNMDSIGKDGLQFTQFHVNPVCSPTRSSMLTGRYYYRTGVVDTYLGRSMMYPDEVTLAEMLGGAGYRTGIFGKWHLGDHYPLRTIDQGFQESVVCTGGGLTQPSDPPGNTYFDPILMHNGKEQKYRGYCTDIFAAAAMEFIEQNKNRPFFAYIPTNAPHAPLQIDESYVAPFRAMGLDDTTARIYGMVANLDENIGRVLAKLKVLNLEQDTIVLFITDNGPQQQRYNAGMRGRKASVYEGGIRVPCFVRWPRMVKAGRKVDRLAAHIDILPTLLEACGVAKPATSPKIDGRSLMPLIRDGKAAWTDRTIYFQWHRGDVPELYRACAARNQRYKLVDGKELYDVEADPAESRNIAAENPAIVASMRKGYEEWFRDMAATRNNGFEPPRIHLGSEFENPVTLTRQDWREEGAAGHWHVQVARTGRYEVTLRMPAVAAAGEARFRLNGVTLKQPVAKGATSCTFEASTFEAGPGRLEALIQSGSKAAAANYVDVKRL
ncbi:MAG: arylsulfatase [Bryobacteraceae bacterium]